MNAIIRPEADDAGVSVVIHYEDVESSTRIGLGFTQIAQFDELIQSAIAARAMLIAELTGEIPELPFAEGGRNVVAQWAAGEEK